MGGFGGLGQVINMAGQAGIGAKFGASGRAIAMGSVSAIATAINPILGALTGLIGLFSGAPRLPIDILNPLRAMQSEIAAGRINSDVYRKWARVFEMRRQGILGEQGVERAGGPATMPAAAVLQQYQQKRVTNRRPWEKYWLAAAELQKLKSRPPMGMAQRNSYLAKIRGLETTLLSHRLLHGRPGHIWDIAEHGTAALATQRKTFGNLTARQILASVDIVPGEHSFGLVPIGSVVNPAMKQAWLQSAPPVLDIPARIPREDLEAFLLREEFRRQRQSPAGGKKTLLTLFEGITPPDILDSRLAEIILARGADLSPEVPIQKPMGPPIPPPPPPITTRPHIPGPVPIAAPLPPILSPPVAPAPRPITTRPHIPGPVPIPPRPIYGPPRPEFLQPAGEPDVSLTGIIDAVGGALGGIIQAGAPLATTFIQGKYGPSAPIMGGVGPIYGGVMPGGVPVSLAPPATVAPNMLQATPALGLPFMDVAPQGGAGLFDPWKVTASGNQVAKSFPMVKANGNVEWFMPAGQPTGFTKASRKRRRHHHHPPAHRRRRKR